MELDNKFWVKCNLNSIEMRRLQKKFNIFIDVCYQKVNIAKNEAMTHAFVIGVGKEIFKYDVLT
jgi:hypothetical protein